MNPVAANTCPALWLMDVDGVLSPFGRSEAYDDWRRSPHERYALWLSPSQTSAIHEVLETTGTELVWVSTWAEKAPRAIDDVLGWPRHRYVPLPSPDARGSSRGPSGRWWKLEAVERLFAEQRPARFVWSDDDHPHHRSDVEAALERFDACGLLQAPEPTVGLTPQAIHAARAHLASCCGA